MLILLRKRYDLTQKDLASRFEVSAQAVSKWERGENLPESKLLLHLSHFYNVTVDELLNGKLSDKTIQSFSNKKKIIIDTIATVLILMSLLIRVFTQSIDIQTINIISTTLLSFGVITILVSSINDYKKISIYNNAQKILFTASIVIYFLLNYFLNLWEITWTIFLLTYVVGQYIGKNNKEQ